MTFIRLQDRLRLELLRRLERGTLSVSLLARQTGLGQAHVSNFLHGRRGLSLKTLDKMLAAQRMTVADLMPAPREGRGVLLSEQMGEVVRVPLVSDAVAIYEPYIRLSSVQTMVACPGNLLENLRERCTAPRKQWERLVVVRVGAEAARAMEPMLGPDALVVLDRHYNSFRRYRERAGESAMNAYGVRVGTELKIRFADLQARRVVLRPVGMQFPVEVVEPGNGETANDLLVGRVALVLREG